MSRPDVLVVGGGPAGSTLAGLLSLRGWRVALLDRARFPRPKACGECINPGGVRALRRLGLDRVVEPLGPVRLEGWDLTTDGGHGATGLFGPGVGHGLAVSRRSLDAALLAHARELGVTVSEGVRVTGVEEGTAGTDPAVSVIEASGRRRKRRARVVVGADGLRSVTARSLGAPVGPDRTGKLSLTLHVRASGHRPTRGRLVLASSGTLGLAPLGPSRWNATVVVSSRRRGREVAEDPAAFALAFLRRHGPAWESPPVREGGPWGSGNFDFRVRRVVGHGVLLVGDAAGYYDPLTGQGIYRALRSAELAAPVLDGALRSGAVSQRDLAAYARRLAGEFGPGRGVQRLIEGVVSRRRLRELTVARLGAAPGSMDALVRVTGDARPLRSLLRPRAWLPLLVPGAGGENVGHRHPRARRRGRAGGSNAPEAPHSIG